MGIFGIYQPELFGSGCPTFSVGLLSFAYQLFLSVVKMVLLIFSNIVFYAPTVVTLLFLPKLKYMYEST